MFTYRERHRTTIPTISSPPTDDTSSHPIDDTSSPPTDASSNELNIISISEQNNIYNIFDIIDSDNDIIQDILFNI